MSNEKIRENFEAWAITQGSSVKRCDPDDPNKIIYMYVETQAMWLAWHASRAAIEVELPDWFDPYGGSGEQAYWRIEVDRAIEEAGLRIKP